MGQYCGGAPLISVSRCRTKNLCFLRPLRMQNVTAFLLQYKVALIVLVNFGILIQFFVTYLLIRRTGKYYPFLDMLRNASPKNKLEALGATNGIITVLLVILLW